MPAFVYTLLLSVLTIFAYIWIYHPILTMYTLQFFAVSIVIFLIMRKLRRKNLLSSKEDAIPYELVIFSTCLFIFIGTYSNNLQLLFPILTIAIFCFVFFAPLFISLTTSLLTLVFIVSNNQFNQSSDYTLLFMIPLLLCLFLFTKKQYDLAHAEELLLAQQSQKVDALQTKSSELESFIQDYLKPKIAIIEELAEENEQDCELIRSQLELLDTELDKQLLKLQSAKQQN